MSGIKPISTSLDINKFDSNDYLSGSVPNNNLSSIVDSIASTFEEFYSIPQLGDLSSPIDFSSITEEELLAYEARINEIVANASSRREAIVNLTIFMASEFPQLPYVLAHSCGHDGTDLTGLHWINDIVDYGNGEQGNRTLDCSGFVNWCFMNAGLPIAGDNGIVSEYVSTYGVNYDGAWNASNIETLNSDCLGNTRPGDFVLISDSTNFGHIGIVVDVNYETHEITAVHTSYSGDGMNITTMNVDTATVSHDQVGPGGSDRVGDHYFTHVMHVNYGDE